MEGAGDARRWPGAGYSPSTTGAAIRWAGGAAAGPLEWARVPARRSSRHCGIGIGEDRVRAFYRNCQVIKEVEDLPGALAGVVEGVLVGAFAGHRVEISPTPCAG